MNFAALSTAVGLAATLGGGGYWAATHVADRESLQVVAVKADYAIDKHIEYMLAQITRLEQKPNKTQDERDQLRYLRDELERLRKIRQGG